ncbi:MAG: response regulator [Chitinophagales bacterium]
MHTKQTILLVDDDAEDRLFFIETLLEIEGATLFDVAYNGREALDRLENTPLLPTLIFMDINMPLMNGMECLLAIRKNPQISGIPVIILSGSTSEIAQAQALGAMGFIQKTDNTDLMRKQLTQLIDLDFLTEGHIANQSFKMALESS